MKMYAVSTLAVQLRWPDSRRTVSWDFDVKKEAPEGIEPIFCRVAAGRLSIWLGRCALKTEMANEGSLAIQELPNQDEWSWWMTILSSCASSNPSVNRSFVVRLMDFPEFESTTPNLDLSVG